MTNDQSQRSRFTRRDPRVWVSILTMFVAWGLALLNMAGFTVKSRGSTANASDWKMAVAIAAVCSVILVPLVIARIVMWKKVVPATAVVETARRKSNGMYFTYRYEFEAQTHHGKFSVIPKSPLFHTMPGDQITVYVHPQKPAKSVMPL
jgi:hypothetical protein